MRPRAGEDFLPGLSCSGFPMRLLVAASIALCSLPYPATSESLEDLRRQQAILLHKLSEREPNAPYLVVDTHDNRLLLRSRGHEILRQAVCATGAARKFEGTKARHRWNFATPMGRFSILRKERDPIWIKPEWAFLESEEAVPIFAEDRRRFQRGVLGEYALYFAKDYMIHGTLYETNLGRNITHGCVRVGARDLAYLFENVDLGTPVFIY